MALNEQTSVKPPHIRKLIKNPPDILKGFHHEDLIDFLSIGIKEIYGQNDTIVGKSDFSNSGYLICAGKVAVWSDNIELLMLPEGSFLGETFLFSESNRIAKIVALENDTTILRFQRHDMLMFFKKKPAKLFNIFTRNIIYVQQQKLAHMNELLLGLKKRLLEYETNQ